MKKKLLMMLCVTIMCVGFGACGGEAAELTTNPNDASPAVNGSTIAPTVTPTAEPEQTPVVEDSSKSEEYEQVIGDVDVDISNITVADMVSAEYGSDIPLVANERDLTIDDIGVKGLSILFPPAMYWTEQSPMGTHAYNEDRTVTFQTTAYVHAGTNVTTGRGFDEYDYGRYTVYVRNSATRAGTPMEDLTSMAYEIFIVDSEADSHMIISIGACNRIDGGVDMLNEYKQVIIADLLSQVEAMAQ